MATRFGLSGIASTLMLTLAALSGGAAAVSAQSEYPNKPIELVTPFAAGGAGDGSARIFAQHLGKTLGQQVNVINRPGGNTIPAVVSIINAEPDGYTLLWDGPA